MSTAHHHSAGMEFPFSPRSNPSNSACHATNTSTTKARQGTTQNTSSYSKSKRKLSSTRTSTIPSSHHKDDTTKYGDDLRGGGSSSKKARRPPSETGFLSMGAWCEPRPARDEALVLDGYARGADGTSAWTPPATPYIGRLNTPPLSPMAYDTEFQPRRHEEQQEDSINENWYLARKSKMDMKLDAAKAYMAQRKGGNHPRME
ncbi:hypothetical protein SAPIO_CDS1316 [Scedosporium apiospermum]|uniref:Uncharacterized protein n=1 Tax=Pseudallescheria apiosperma TaxID=563466 RepID=A0A084GF20_PSEDA|nr:uncharacterized protein SAPIO_CDS1316 [Scedosporium apiospermum]KEZ45932.1 hypothetical protein SAPIO_CDS1316 [Scedosporium apiospermum]